jgi:hypothetical protein
MREPVSSADPAQGVAEHKIQEALCYLTEEVRAQPAPQSGLPSWQAGLASNSTQNINDSTKLHPINLH